MSYFLPNGSGIQIHVFLFRNKSNKCTKSESFLNLEPFLVIISFFHVLFVLPLESTKITK